MTQNRTQSATAKKGFIMYTDNRPIIDKLSDEDAGKLLKAIMLYEDTQQYPDLSGAMAALFESFKRYLDVARDNHRRVSEIRSIVGKKGIEAKLSKAKQNEAIAYDKDKDKDKEKDIINKDGSSFLSELREERRKLIDEWLRYKKDRRETYKPASIKKLIEKWDAFSDADLIQAIDTSISNGWSGLFEPKNKPAPKKVVYTRGF